jgi:hypothetical protein
LRGALSYKLTSIFKYIPEQYLEAFLNNGELLFRSLSYFQHYEDNVRGDKSEGARLYKPESALEITKTQTGEKVLLTGGAFQSNVDADNIFIFCASRVLSKDLASAFNCNICVEITSIATLLSKIRASLLIRPSIKNKTLLFGDVAYYDMRNPPIIDWAIPEKIVMSKLDAFKTQNEFRISYCLNNAFDIKQTTQTIKINAHTTSTIIKNHPSQLLKVGSIRKICKIHSMGD